MKKQWEVLKFVSLFRINPTENYNKATDVNNVHKEKIIRDIGNLFEDKEEDYYKLEKGSKLYYGNFITYESRSNKNKSLN